MVLGEFVVKARRLIKSAYTRVTLSGVTLSFFLLSVSFCILQILFQGFLWNEDSAAFNTLDGILENTDVPTSLLRWLTVKENGYHLRLCTEPPDGAQNVSQVCPTIFDSLSMGNSSWIAPDNIRKHSRNDSSPLLLTIGLQDGENLIEITEQCTYTLLYPMQRLRNSVDEEIALVFSQVWLLGISSSAVLSQSIPHILAVFAMRCLATGWSAYTIWRTIDLRTRLWHLIMAPNTPCHTDFEFLPDYFKSRLAFQVPDLILNVVALIFTGLLGWRLVKSFSRNVFNCVGPPAKIIRLYGYMLTVFVSGQLLSYLLTTSISLALKEGLQHNRLVGVQIGLFILAFTLTIAMYPLGYYAVRHERKLTMIAFIVILFGLIISFFSLFSFRGFRFTWLQWPFFACITGVNAAVIVCCAVFAVLCRKHFGEGLTHYLNIEQLLSKQNFAPDEFSTEDKNVRHQNEFGNGTLDDGKRDEKWDFMDRSAPIYTLRFNVNGRVA
ncbi:hypothetical protein BDY19DRAFT_438960 [Irpex rosettiformis]|uniref:Uncharacterized protein n=1 Tax=Irpex rosettiformis TaxID=378272 RepID=A0ACB8TUB9_9APHY|nr:hypothetical protein BDY19DRAFT_438960 [Irpex rosettiformis]